MVRRFGNHLAARTSNLGVVMEIYELNLGAAARMCENYGISPHSASVPFDDDDADEDAELQAGIQLLKMIELK